MIRSRIHFFVLVMTAVVLTMGVSTVEADPPANFPWSLETIATITGGDVGQHTSIAFNENTGKPYISYYDETNQDLRLIYPHATFGNCGPNNQWYCEAPDTAGDVGQHSSIDYFVDSVTGAVKIGIAYYDATNSDLKVAIWSTTPYPGWRIYKVNAEPLIGSYKKCGHYASLKFDSNGTVHIAYVLHLDQPSPLLDSYFAMHAYSVSSGGDCGDGAAAGKWQCDTISFNEFSLPSSTSLDLTSTNEPRVAFFNEFDDKLKFCRKDAGAWSCRTIESTGGSGAQVFVSLAVDQSDQPHIAYYDHHNGKLKYATYVGSAGNCGLNGATYEYQCDVLDTIGDSQSQVGLSIAVDPDGYPVIAYEDASDPMGFSVLNIARPALAHGTTVGNCGPIVNLFRRWQCTTIDDATQGGGAGHLYEAAFASVAVDPNGLAAIAYNEIDDYYNEGRLKFAYQEFSDPIFSDDFESGDGSAWTTTVGGP